MVFSGRCPLFLIMARYNEVRKRKAVSNMKRWMNIMTALVFGAVLLCMAAGNGEAAPAPAGGVRHGQAVEYKHARHESGPRLVPLNRHRGRHDRYDRHGRRHPHFREIHHRPRRHIRHDRHPHGRHARSGGIMQITLAMDI